MSKKRQHRLGRKLLRGRPHVVASLVGGAFLVLMALYIYVSSSWAASISADDVSWLRRVEVTKGVVVMFLASTFIWGIVYWLLREVEAKTQENNQHRQRLQDAERRAISSLFSATVAHDSNNLLGVARTLLELTLADKTLPAKERERLERVTRMLADLIGMNRRLVDVSRTFQRRDEQVFDLTAHACRALEFASFGNTVRQCDIHVDLQSGLRVKGDPVLFQQALVNLIVNAAEAGGPGCYIRMQTRMEGSHAVLEVHDNGPGIPPEKRLDVFQPFYTEKAEGTGLGLVTVRAFADAHKADLSIEDSDLGGACFRIRLLLEKEAPKA